MDLLNDCRYNRLTSFSPDERRRYGLVGFLPEKVETESLKLRRVLHQLDLKPDDIEKHIYLSALHDIDENLYYTVIKSDPARFIPIIYTPTVGEACRLFGQIFRRPRGLYLSVNRRGQLEDILRSWPEDDVRFIVVTDGERVLGLGDLGVYGMGIPIGKLALYTACGGVPPRATLPIVLDVGTNNEDLLSDPFYLGLCHPRVDGEAYDSFVDEFVRAARNVYPKVCIQFEDFSFRHAMPILARYRQDFCCFNDDIQGTASVVLGGVKAALRIKGESLSQQKFLFLGAGSAGTGIAGLLTRAMMIEGMAEEEARRRCWLFDVHGLVQSNREDLALFQKPFAHAHDPVENFLRAVDVIRPTAIIGVSASPGAFNRDVVAAMSRINERPIILPLSNPTSFAECTARDAYAWSDGRAIFASGSPFSPVSWRGKTLVPGQGNNAYIFPAVGMAVYVTEAKIVREGVFVVAADSLSKQVRDADLSRGLIYPEIKDLSDVSLRIAADVAAYIFDSGDAGVTKRPKDIYAHIRERAYVPKK